MSPKMISFEPYQKKALKQAKRYNGYGLFLVQGSGKTLITLEVINYRIKSSGIKKILIIGPLSAIDVWEQHLKEFQPFPHQFIKFESRQGKNKELIQPRKEDCCQVVTINYQSLVRRVNVLKKWKPDFVIADECHNIKDRQAAQTKAAWKIADVAQFRLGLSGTPQEQSPIDLWAQFRFFAPKVFGKSWRDFEEVYTRTTGYGYRKIVVRKRKLPRLIKLIRSRSHRVEKDVLKLPPMKRVIARFNLSKKGRTIYDEIEAQSVVDIGTASAIAPIILTKYLRLQQITGGFLPDEYENLKRVDNRKLRKLAKVMDRFPKSKKIVIFTRFLSELEDINTMCKSIGRPSVTLLGDIPLKQRTAIRKTFAESTDINTIICQIRTGGVGINELKVANLGIIYSSTYSWIDYDQAISRLHRRGQTHPVTIIHLLARDTIDEDIYATLRAKGKFSDIVLNMRRRISNG